MSITMLSCLVLMLVVLQESVFLLEAKAAEECITRHEVELLLKEMERKQEAIIASLKNEIIELKQDKLRFESEIRETLTDRLSEGVSTSNDKNVHSGGRGDEINRQTVLQSDQIANGIMQAHHIGLTPNKTGIKRYLLAGGGQGAAFTVTISTSGIEHLGHNQHIHFDKVISNLGNAFDARISTFRVPQRGWYVFSLTLMTRPNEKKELYVMKKGVEVFHCYSRDAVSSKESQFCHPETGDEYNTVSRTVVVHANTGDDVWVQTASYDTSSNVHGLGHTSFTGFLLYSD